jgi:hypothetical protein
VFDKIFPQKLFKHSFKISKAAKVSGQKLDRMFCMTFGEYPLSWDKNKTFYNKLQMGENSPLMNSVAFLFGGQ